MAALPPAHRSRRRATTGAFKRREAGLHVAPAISCRSRPIAASASKSAGRKLSSNKRLSRPCMTTARDIIAGAYQRLGLLPLGSDLDPDRTAAGLTTYNDMLNAWAADGIFPGGPYPPIQQTDGFYAAASSSMEASKSPAGLPSLWSKRYLDATFWPRSLLRSRRQLSRSSLNSWRGRKPCSPSNLRPQSGIEPQPSLQKRAQKARDGAARLLRDRAERGPGHRPDLDAESSAIRVSVASVMAALDPRIKSEDMGGHPGCNSLRFRFQSGWPGQARP